MTCIIGWADDARMVMGADSLAARSSWDAAVRRDRKMFRLTQENGADVLIGFTSSYRMGQLLMGLALPCDHGTDPFRWMVEHFIPIARTRLKDGGYTSVNSNREEGGEFLVAYRGRIFTVYADFQVAERADRFDAIGCGGAFALGALSVLDVPANPEAAILRALAVAESLSAGVRGPMLTATVFLA